MHVPKYLDHSSNKQYICTVMNVIISICRSTGVYIYIFCAKYVYEIYFYLLIFLLAFALL